MTRYLLDTTALIDFSKDREPAQSRIMGMVDAGDELGICAINVTEFYTGIPPAERAVWDEFIGALHYWEITWTVARQAGFFRYEFARRGQTLSTTDSIVAAVAWQRGAIIVTDNVKHYPIKEVRLLPLRGTPDHETRP